MVRQLPRWGSVRQRAHLFAQNPYGRLVAVCGFSARAERVAAASGAHCLRCQWILQGEWGQFDKRMGGARQAQQSRPTGQGSSLDGERAGTDSND